MPIQELLAQVDAEHQVLQAKYDEALVEISFLRTHLAALQVPQSGLGQDIEAIPHLKQLQFEPLHYAPYAPSPQMSKEVSFQEIQTTGTALRLSGLDRTPSSCSTLAKKSKHNKSVISGMWTHDNKHYLEVAGARSGAEEDLGNNITKRTILFLRHPLVEFVLLSVVLSNIIVMWVETDDRAAREARASWGKVMEWVYLSIYVLEFALRVFAFRTHVFVDLWARLDFAVIAVDIVSIVLEALFGNVAFGGLNASMFRLLRLFRLVRVLKVLRFVEELQLLIHGFMGAITAVFYATIMLEVVVVLWSFVFVEVIHPQVREMSGSGFFEQCSTCVDVYSSIWRSHMTIWKQVIASDSWGLVTMDVISENPLSAFIFIGCFSTIQFAMLNLIFTVIVDAALRAREADMQLRLEEKEKRFEAIKEQLITLCQSIDGNGNGELSLAELRYAYEHNKEFADTMASLDITPDDLNIMFWIMDEDRSGTLSYVEFVNNVYKMREQDSGTMLMIIKGYMIDLHMRVKQDVQSLLKKNLQQSEKSAKQLAVLSNDVEHIAENMGAGTYSVSSSKHEITGIFPGVLPENDATELESEDKDAFKVPADTARVNDRAGIAGRILSTPKGVSSNLEIARSAAATGGNFRSAAAQGGLPYLLLEQQPVVAIPRRPFQVSCCCAEQLQER